MECLTEERIELLVLAELAGGKENASAMKHISMCEYCNNRHRKLNEFYATFDELNKRPATPAELQLLKGLKSLPKPWLYTAYPLHLPETFTSYKPAYSVLAAAPSDLSQSTLFENIGVLATGDQDIIVRVMKIKKTGDITLHLIADEEEKYSHVLVRIPPLPGEFTSDENGKVHIGKVILPGSKDRLVEIQTPRATFDLTSMDLQREKVIAQTELVLTNEHKSTIKVEFIPDELRYTLKVHLLKMTGVDDKNRLKVMVIRGEKDELIKTVQKGIAVFQGIKQNGELIIKVFD